jgi:hypothetical protein
LTGVLVPARVPVVAWNLATGERGTANYQTTITQTIPNHHKEKSIMPYQNIDASLSAADLQAINDAFAAVLQKLPFLVNLTVDERRSTLKTGPDRVSFVKNANTAAQSHPEIFPASFSKEGFKKDVDLFEVLTELSTRAASVLSQIDDTRMAVGGEAMQEAIQVYNYVTEAAKTMPGLKPVADQLGEQFKKAGKPKEPAKPNP